MATKRRNVSKSKTKSSSKSNKVSSSRKHLIKSRKSGSKTRKMRGGSKLAPSQEPKHLKRSGSVGSTLPRERQRGSFQRKPDYTPFNMSKIGPNFNPLKNPNEPIVVNPLPPGISERNISRMTRSTGGLETVPKVKPQENKSKETLKAIMAMYGPR